MKMMIERLRQTMFGCLPLPDKITQGFRTFIGIHTAVSNSATTSHLTPNCASLPVQHEACRTRFITGA